MLLTGSDDARKKAKAIIQMLLQVSFSPVDVVVFTNITTFLKQPLEKDVVEQALVRRQGL